MLQQLLSDKVMKVILLIAGALLIVTFMHGCEQSKNATKYEQEMKTWKKTAESALANSAKTDRMNDSLAKENAVQKQKGDSLNSVIGKLQTKRNEQGRKNDSTIKDIIDQVPDTCKTAIATVDSLRKVEINLANQQIANLNQLDTTRLVTISNLQVALKNMTADRDSLKKVVLTVPVAKKDKLLGFIPLPSRKQSFVTGVVTGIVVTGAVLSVIR